MIDKITQKPLVVVSSVKEFDNWKNQEISKGRRVLVTNTTDSNNVPCFFFLSANMDKHIEDDGLENYVQINHDTITNEWVKSVFQNVPYD